jgi:hypothetical protein
MDQEKREYYEQVFGKDKAAEIIASLEDKAKHLEAIQASYKDFTSVAETTETSEETTAKDHVESNLKALAADLITDVAELTAHHAAISKEQNSLRAWVQQELTARDAAIATLQAENKALRDELALTPQGRASESENTVVVDSDLQAKIEAKENDETDPFWKFALDKKGAN